VPYLTNSLNKILIHHIQRCIPSLNKQITEHLQQKERELVDLASDDVDPDVDKGPMILGLINSFINTYGDKIEGRFVKEIAVECIGGSRINYLFHEIFNKVVNSIDPFEYLTEQDIQTAIKNASALTPSLFVPEGAFEVLIR
jgi:dynamin 1-like protein